MPEEQQLAFYEKILETEGKTDTFLHASFNYAKLFFYNGKFRKAIDILEPIIVDYLSYPYTPKLLPCFNLLGTALHCETSYVQSRFVFQLALDIAKEKGDKFFYSYEYCNIASVLYYDKKYEAALKNLEQAEKYISYTHESMPAFVYMNKCAVYQRLNRLDEALEAWRMGVEQNNAEKYLKYDAMRTSLTMYYWLKDMEKYALYKKQLLEQMHCMSPAELMDACKDLYECGVDSGDDELIRNVFTAVEQYLGENPKEIHVGLTVADLRYDFAKRTGDKDALLDALEMKNRYKDRIILTSSENEARTMNRFIKINSQMQEAIKSKEKAVNAKSQFLANMSHDIRTPLNGIIGLLKINETHFDDRKLVRKNQEKMQVVADHLQSLINNILDMSKIEDGSIVLANEPVDFKQLAREIIIIISNIAKSNNITLTFKLSHNQTYPCVYGSTVHLKQIFLNIYSNCIKYNRVNGSISTKMEVVSQNKTECRYRWTITDTGIGMSDEFLAHIYEPFRQENRDIMSTSNGTGMGMAIVKGLIEQMKGTISIESKEGEGSTFTIEIPFKILQAPLADDTITHSNVHSINGLNILLVEDNDLNLEIAKTLLEYEGASVTIAKNGKDAMELFNSSAPHTFDAILMDIMMPVMDGLTATRQIRQLQREDAQTIPIIALSANVYQEDINRCHDAGMNAHLAKPLNINKMRKVIYECIKTGT